MQLCIKYRIGLYIVFSSGRNEVRVIWHWQKKWGSKVLLDPTLKSGWGPLTPLTSWFRGLWTPPRLFHLLQTFPLPACKPSTRSSSCWYAIRFLQDVSEVDDTATVSYQW